MKEEKKEDKKNEKKQKSNGHKLVMPKKNFVICHNEHYYELREGKEVEVPEVFLQNLKTEKVI